MNKHSFFYSEMNFYLTIESYSKLTNAFTNLNSFYIINVNDILRESSLDINKPSHKFLINAELERLITLGVKSKKHNGIIYIYNNITSDIIYSIKNVITKIGSDDLEGITILDDYDVPKLHIYYKIVDEVIFFPAFKRTKILQCTPVSQAKLRKIMKEIENEKNKKTD